MSELTPNDNQDSIYRAPAAATNVAPGDDLMSAYLGPKNADFYRAAFSRFENVGSGVSWNWPAFFISSIWLLYRKMWLNAAIYWVGLPIGLVLVSLLLSNVMGEEAADIVANVGYLLVTFVVVPMFANALYYKHAQNKIDKISSTVDSAEEQRLQAARAGGTSSIVLVVVPLFLVFIIGVVAAISIPAYQDYSVRAQVAEGLMLAAPAKAAVDAHWDATGKAATDNDAAGLAPAGSISGRYVTSVAIVDGRIVVNYGGEAHQLLQNKTLLLHRDDGGTTWRCSSDTIAAPHLPSACR